MVSNIPIIRRIIDISIQPTFYRYSNSDGSFTAQSSQESLFSATHEGLINNFKLFVNKENTNHVILYRLFTKNPIYIWKWYSYFFSDEYKLPYKSWEEIEPNRTPYSSKNMWQSF